MEKTLKTGKLAELAEGSRFTYGGVEWVVLDHRVNMALCLAADVLENRAFDENEKNDFAASSLRAYLNGEFLKKLIEAGADEAAFMPMVMDLTSDDGLEDYGKDTAKIGLISCDMYRHFRKLIPNASNWWWTCTPYSTESNGYANNVRYVRSDGTLSDYYAYLGGGGVRPLCALKSEILVSFNEEQIKKREVPTFQSALEAAVKKAFESLERRIVEGEGKNEPKGILSELGNKAEDIEEAGKRAQAVDMMKHIAAAFDIPVQIDGETAQARTQGTPAEGISMGACRIGMFECIRAAQERFIENAKKLNGCSVDADSLSAITRAYEVMVSIDDKGGKNR